MAAEMIHKLEITSKAVFDYREVMSLGELNRVTFKVEIEKYITNMFAEGRLMIDYYFRCNYYDDNSGQMLMLFIYRAEKLGLMQLWRLEGICRADDWCEELEDDGTIKSWLKSAIDDFYENTDWAVKVRTKKVLHKTEKIVFENILQEVRNEFENKRDKKAAEELLFLQSYYFRRRNGGKQLKRKNRRH